MLVYSETDLDSKYYETMKKEQWIITDPKLLDSLKAEYKCVLTEQSDCIQCYSIDLYKNNCFYTSFVFDNKNYFSLGELKKILVPATMEELYCSNHDIAKSKADSLNSAKVPLYYFPDIDKAQQYTFTLRLSFDNINKAPEPARIKYTHLPFSYDRAVKAELLKLFPTTDSDHIQVYAAGLCYKVVIECNKDFVFDNAKLDNNKVIRFYDVLGLGEQEYWIKYFVNRQI